MATIAYIRVSTEHQNTQLQREAMPADIETIFEEKVSGKSKERPALKECLKYVRKGDELYVYSISRFARNTRDLLEMVEDLTARGIEFISIKEKVDTRTAQGKFILTVWGAMAEMEREQILERQADGIAVAKANGAYTGRQPIKVDEKEFKRIVSIWKQGEITAREAMNRLNLKPNTFYRRVKELEQGSNN